MITVRAVISAAWVAGLVGACGGNNTEAVAPRPSCLSAPRDFRPAPSVRQEWADANGDMEAVPAALRLNQCNTKYGQIEGIHCGPKIDALCDQQCTSEPDKTTCRQTYREELMQECRVQVFKDFVGAIPSCCPVKLDGSQLVATTDPCPPP